VSNRTQTIDKLIREQLKPDYLKITDDSVKHAGHRGAVSGGGHYIVTVVSEAFEGKVLMEQHRMVNEILKELFQTEIHALALNTFAPSQWKQRSEQTGNQS
jgi:BolA protein